MLLNGNWNYLKDEFNEYSFEEAKEKLNSSQNDIKVPRTIGSSLELIILVVQNLVI